MKSLSSSQTPNEPAMTPVRPQFWTLDEAAQQLKLSSRSFFDLRGKHPFYEPDGSRNLGDDPKKIMPLWSDDLIRLIAFARSLTVQGIRQLSDDEALKVRKGMGDARRRAYLAFIDE